MRKLGYILLVLGFVWVTFVAVEVGPVARAMRNLHQQKVYEQQSYTRKDVEVAFQEAAYGVAHFAQPSFIGGLLMLAGGLILGKAGRRNSAAKIPPVLSS
ncbi:MAG: hypothetical protein ABSH11_04940 [Verrucomicrobiota bacterium]|jgi:hypothetical protein